MLYPDKQRGDLTALNHIDGGREIAEAAKNFGMNLSNHIGGFIKSYTTHNTPSEFLKN